MSSSGTFIDLSNDSAIATVESKKRKAERPQLDNVWIAFHQLEGNYECVGDYETHGSCYSHNPTMFDKTILGIFVTREAANKCANEYWWQIKENDEDEDDDDNDDDPDFVGEGKFIDGQGLHGDVNTFSQRVVVEMMRITHE